MGARKEDETILKGIVFVALGLLILVGLIGWFLFNPQSVFGVVNRFPVFAGFTILGLVFNLAMGFIIAGLLIVLTRNGFY